MQSGVRVTTQALVRHGRHLVLPFFLGALTVTGGQHCFDRRLGVPKRVKYESKPLPGSNIWIRLMNGRPKYAVGRGSTQTKESASAQNRKGVYATNRFSSQVSEASLHQEEKE